MEKHQQHHSGPEQEWLYSEIKKLIPFVDFVAGLHMTTDEQWKTANRIKGLLGNFEETHGLWQWNVCLNIFDYDIQGRNGTGNYWRKWWVFFENGRLEIEAATFHSDDDHYPIEDHYTFDAYAAPGGETGHESLGDLDRFIKDARNYETYLTESLNSIEIDIELWERK